MQNLKNTISDNFFMFPNTFQMQCSSDPSLNNSAKCTYWWNYSGANSFLSRREVRVWIHIGALVHHLAYQAVVPKPAMHCRMWMPLGHQLVGSVGNIEQYVKTYVEYMWNRSQAISDIESLNKTLAILCFLYLSYSVYLYFIHCTDW